MSGAPDRRRFEGTHSFGLVALLLFLAGAAACGGRDAPEQTPIDETEQVAESATPFLRVVVPADPALGILEGRRPFQLELWRYVYPSLIRVQGSSEFPPASLPVPQPDLARSWEWLPDESTLHLALDPGRAWSDGTLVTVDDVVRSYRFLIGRNLVPASLGPAGSAHAGSVRMTSVGESASMRPRDPLLRAVEPTDAGRVALRFSPGTPPWLAYEVASLPVLSQVEIDLATGALRPEAGTPPPSPRYAGPFRPAPEEKAGEVRLLARHGEGVAAEPRIDGILVETVPGDAGRIERVLRGEADVALDLAPARVEDALGAAETAVLHTEAVGSIELLVWNLGRTDLDPALREAVDVAIDRARLARLFTVADSVHATPAGGFALDPRTASLPDPERARALLPSRPDPSGHPSDAPLESSIDSLESTPDLRHPGSTRPASSVPSGGPGRFDVRRRTLTLYYDRANESREGMATLLEEDLARIDVTLQAVPLDGEELFRRCLAGEFETALLGFQPPMAPDLASLFASWGSWNVMRYASSVVDSLVRETYRTEGDEVLRLARLTEEEVRRDRPVLFLVRRQRLDLVHARVRGFEGSTWLPLGPVWKVELAAGS